uniref:Uncharacterized protein n=1 Tax=Arundo donax TaxID=35708 RepID=A0A0A8XYE2_ARUDO
MLGVHFVYSTSPSNV